MRTRDLSRFVPALLLPVAPLLQLPLLLLFSLLPAACISEPLVEPSGGSDGNTTRVTLSLTGLALQNRSLPYDQEEQVENLHLLVFDDAGAVITNEHFAGLAITGTGSVSFETLPGADRQIVVIANGDVNDDTNGQLDAALRKVTTQDELKAVLVSVKGTGLTRTGRLTMVGSTTVTIGKPHTATIPVALHYLAAKVTVTVKDNISAPLLGITITGWDVVNIPKRTFLHERTGSDQQDAVTGTKPGDYLTTAGKYEFEQKDDALKTRSQSFYLFENRRGGRVDREDPPNAADKYPGMSVDDDNQRGKAWYAPPGATYLLIYGTHELNGQTNNIVYKIYLGENPVNDYNLFRGRHYRYNVTINGLNDINVDTNVEWDSASFSVDASDNLLMDAHPDFRVFRIGGTAVDAVTFAYATVQVLEPDGVTPCTWLAVSPLNLYRHGIKQAGNERQQFAPGDGAGSFVRSKYTPVPTAESTLANCTFGLTRRLTRISFEQPAVYTYQNVILYADALDIPETERRAKVKITYYKGPAGDEVAGERTFDITQQGPVQVSANLYMERYEESAMLMHPGLASGLQGTELMQWGYPTAMLYAADDRYSNGNYLTANAVYNTLAPRREMADPEWTATDYAAYREKYPHQGGQVTEPNSMPTLGAPYYYPEMTAITPTNSYFHPVFNASAARYCHEKNRDTDGDGIISKEETVWYLPSYADMVALKKNLSASTNLTGTYWTSTEEESGKSWAITLPTGTMVVVDKTTTYRVRCVRGKGTVIPEATMESGESDKTKINLSAEKGANGLFKITDDKDFGLPWTVTSTDATWLKIATDDKGANASDSQTGINDKTLYAYATTDNTSTTTRSTSLILTRFGMHEKVISVTQSYMILPPMHSGWAGCNIYWEPIYDNGDGTKGRLTFDDVGVATHEKYQGVYFQWGSLVAISPSGNYSSSTSILFSPTGETNYKYDSIPQVSITCPANSVRHNLLEIHDPTRNIGDICKYMTDKGWAPGFTEGKKWRMPTSSELSACVDYLSDGKYDIVSSTNSNGQMSMSSGRTGGAGKYLPCSGRREPTSYTYNVGNTGLYWGGDANGIDGGGAILYFNIPSMILQTQPLLYGLSVRCVKE